MAKHTITITDIDGGISIGLEGDGEPGSLAGITALALAMQAKRAAKAARKSSGPDGCGCPICQASRAALQVPPGTTIH
jgi:hypothetical protein